MLLARFKKLNFEGRAGGRQLASQCVVGAVGCIVEQRGGGVERNFVVAVCDIVAGEAGACEQTVERKATGSRKGFELFKNMSPDYGD